MAGITNLDIFSFPTCEEADIYIINLWISKIRKKNKDVGETPRWLVKIGLAFYDLWPSVYWLFLNLVFETISERQTCLY